MAWLVGTLVILYILTWVVGVYQIRQTSTELGDVYILKRLSIHGWVNAKVNYLTHSVGDWDYTGSKSLRSKRINNIEKYIEGAEYTDSLVRFYLPFYSYSAE